LHAKKYSLTVNKKKCTGCGVCMEICPREAIEVFIAPKTDEERSKLLTLDINKEKCHFCGICEAACLFGALKIKIDGKAVIPVIKTESFPQFIREINVDESKCGLECLKIEDACPLDLIKISAWRPDGKEVVKPLLGQDKKNFKVKIEIDQESCPGCRFCETKFPVGVVSVEKIFSGSLRINNVKCPGDCHNCVDVCPIPGVLSVCNNKVQVNDFHCIYCGCCKIACPEEGALELNRTSVRHTNVRSGAWNRALEKIASTNAVVKEMESKNAKKLMKAIFKRFPPEEADNNND
jgi:4Fe-4S ferredoxin